MRRFGGVMGPMVTPFKADESLDMAGFGPTCALTCRPDSRRSGRGIHGEAALLGDDERRKLIETAGESSR
jgi:dihydrodipicolinate synthase/N-acetylneuraminate lyase